MKGRKSRVHWAAKGKDIVTLRAQRTHMGRKQRKAASVSTTDYSASHATGIELKLDSYFETGGLAISRYGLVVILGLIGVSKFTTAEAEGIQQLVSHSPLLSWMYSVWSLQGASNVIGSVELLFALLLAVRFLSAKASFVGSTGAAITFMATLSFLFTTPGALSLSRGIAVLDGTGQFLIKDLALLGASILTGAEALRACRRESVK